MSKKVQVGVALTGFDHNGLKHRDQAIYNTDYSQDTLKQLVAAGFIKLTSSAENPAKQEAATANPKKGAGEQSSASPVAPASQEQTAKESGAGEKKKGGKKKKSQ